MSISNNGWSFGLYDDNTQIDLSEYERPKSGFLDSIYEFFTKYPGGNELDQNLQYFDGPDGYTVYTTSELIDQKRSNDNSNRSNYNSNRNLISYPSETYGSWKNQKTFTDNKSNGSWGGLPSYLMKGSQDIDTTTYRA